MDKETVLKKSLREFKKRVNEDFPVYKMFLFGSQATGKTHKDSDVDLIIVSRKFRQLNFIMRSAHMYDYWTLPMPVDFLCYTPEEFNRLKRQITIVKEAVENGIEIN